MRSNLELEVAVKVLVQIPVIEGLEVVVLVLFATVCIYLLEVAVLEVVGVETTFVAP